MMMKPHGLVKWEDSASWYTEVGKHMVKLHGEEVNVGDKVWHVRRGWGEVYDIDEKNEIYPICVLWGGYIWDWFTKDGKANNNIEIPTLFWQPIEIEIPKKPKEKKEKVWQWVCRTGDNYWLTRSHYSAKEDIYGRFHCTEIIEPYLPSEKERDVKE